MYICPCCKKEVQPDAAQCIHCGVGFAPAEKMTDKTVTQAPAENKQSSGTGWKVVCIVLIAVVASAMTIGAVFGFRYIFGAGFYPSGIETGSFPELSSEVIASEESEPVIETGDYMLYGSDSRYVTRSELVGMSEWELRLARNEIYARHGRMFKDDALQSYFDNQSWYYGYISPDKFNDDVLNEYEKANLKLIIDYETEKGYR